MICDVDFKPLEPKYLIGIVTYNPQIDRFKQCMLSTTSQANSIIVIDNGSAESSAIGSIVENEFKGIFVTLNSNYGIAFALNKIFEYAIENKYDYVLTLDQDSILSSDFIASLFTCMDDNVGIVCPMINYENCGVDGLEKGLLNDDNNLPWTITSGSLTSVLSWSQVGGFDERLFIDGVDKDFCIRIRNKGWEIIRCKDAVLNHELGDMKCRKLFHRTIHVTNHSALRHFYIVRNDIYLMRKEIISKPECYRDILQEFLKVILYEEGKINKIKYMLKATRKSTPMGKFV